MMTSTPSLSKSQKLQILIDPVAQFTQNNPHASDEQTAALIQHQQQHEAIKQELKKAQDLSKKTSRLIGEAKRNNQPTDTLLQTMKSQGRSAKELKARLNDLSETIFCYFESEQKPVQALTRPELPPTRTHSNATDGSDITISQLGDDTKAWNLYIDANPATSLYHRAEWRALIHKSFGHECHFFYASCNQKVVGVLPLVRLNSKLFGDFMVSMPYFNYGGAIADSLDIEQKLMASATEFAKQIGTGHIEFRDDSPREDLSARTDKVNMILSLPETEEDLWTSFPSKLRSQIKRAQRENTQVATGGTECLADFYSVFARNMRDLGTPVYSKTLFNNILNTFAHNSKIIIIRHGNRPVAAAFLLGNKNTLEIPWASTINDVNHLSINMLLYWEVLKFAIKNQYLYFDFGRSSKGAGTFRFKQQWGAKPKQLYWHYWLPNNAEMPKLNPDNPKFALAIRIWQKIPIFITKIIGPLIVKNLP